MRVISISSEKGGTAKTTTAVNLAAGLSEEGKTVLLIDLDPQSNAGMSLGYKSREYEGKSTAELLMLEVKLEDITIHVKDNLHLAPASRRLLEIQKILVGGRAVDRRLQRALTTLTGVDFVIIDNAPGSNIIHDNAYMCSNEIIIPIETKLFSAQGLQDVMTSIGEIKIDNPELEITGILITKMDKRRVQDRNYNKGIRSSFGDLVFKTEIPETVRLSEAQGAGKTIYDHARWSEGSMAYKSLVKEVIERGDRDVKKKR